MLMRFLGLASLAGIIGAAGVAGAITLRDGREVTETNSGNVALRREGRPTRNAASSRSRGPRLLTPTPATTAPVTPEPIEPVNPRAVASVTPARTSGRESLLGPGRTPLADSIFAVRSGDSVSVNFDTKGNRTRRADKFERMVRETLPLVYGRSVTSVLDSVPEGSLLPSRDVVGVLTTQGLHLQLDNGVRIGLWPQTREGNDGPLVVAYLVVVER